HADLVALVARGEVEFLVVQQGAGDLDAPILAGERLALQQLVERDRVGCLVARDRLEDAELPFTALELPYAQAKAKDEHRHRENRGPQQGPKPDHARRSYSSSAVER